MDLSQLSGSFGGVRLLVAVVEMFRRVIVDCAVFPGGFRGELIVFFQLSNSSSERAYIHNECTVFVSNPAVSTISFVPVSCTTGQPLVLEKRISQNYASDITSKQRY
jgi:hypothetical protein